MENGNTPTVPESPSKSTSKYDNIELIIGEPEEDVPMEDIDYDDSPLSPDGERLNLLRDRKYRPPSIPSSPVKSSPVKRHHREDHHPSHGSPSKKKNGCGNNDDDADELVVDKLKDPAWDEERRHYLKIVATYRRYSEHVFKKLRSSYNYLKSLPTHHQLLLKDYKLHLKDVKRCVEENQNLCILMVLEEGHLFENQDEIYPAITMRRNAPEPTHFDYEKLQAVFKQIVRDWSKEGERERELCYKPLIEEVERIFSDTKDEEGCSDVKILVPGAGLGRLAHELVRRGYAVEGNEVSLFMLFASNFLLNKCSSPLVFKCFPWIHQTTNVLSRADQIRSVSFPDINPSDLPPSSRFSMTAGDFLEVYKVQPSSWDCIVTCFFIDCANNIVAYLERIYECLKEGGVWINMGPLLYHFADLPEEKSIEPPYDILREVIKNLGFVIEKEQTNMPTLYADNEKSMLAYTYNSIFLVCRKPVQKKLQQLTDSEAKEKIHLENENEEETENS